LEDYDFVLAIFFIVYSYVYTLFGWSIPSAPCLPLPIPLTSKQNLFCHLVQFCWRENIRDNKKGIAFLLAWDKDSYTERFPALLPRTCILQPELVHLYLTSSLLPGYLPIVASVSLILPYLLFYNEHIKHFQVLGFLPFPCSSCMHSPLCVWTMSNNITFVLGLKSVYEGKHTIFGLLSLANFA
jgi:hypothetical protein